MDKTTVYNQLCKDIMGCSKCDLGCELLDGFNPRVPPQGNLDARILVYAEAPGKTETEKCRPLIPPGKSGVKYEETLKELGLSREEVFTSNSSKCRPPKNRDPLPWESLKCREYVGREIELIKPKIIITFGRYAAMTFLNDFKMTRDHGKIQKSEKYGVDIFSLYHPAYVSCYANHKIRQEDKRDVQQLKVILTEKNIIPAEVKSEINKEDQANQK